MPSLPSRNRGPRCPRSVASTAFNNAPVYYQGATFEWKLDDGYNPSIFAESKVQVTILDILSCTASPVMRVRFQTRIGPKTAILKTYDRRMGHFSRILPCMVSPERYDYTSDADVVSFVHEGEAKRLFQSFKRREYDEVPKPRARKAQIAHKELYFQSQRLIEFECETQAYQRMAHLQGQSVPYFIGSLKWLPTCANAEDLKICAILIEEIQDASTLKQFFKDYTVNHNLWYEIKQEERRLHETLRELGIQDMDRHEGNTLIVPTDLDMGDFRILQIDFAYATIRPVPVVTVPVEREPAGVLQAPVPPPRRQRPRGPRDRRQVPHAAAEAPVAHPTATPAALPVRRNSSLDLDDLNIPHQQDLQGPRFREWLDRMA